MEDLVESLSSSIVREFLSKKKCAKTLQILDTEWPRSENSISSRAKLAQALHIETWVSKNKTSPMPLTTMLEVILINIIKLKVSQQNNFVVDSNYSGFQSQDLSDRASSKSQLINRMRPQTSDGTASRGYINKHRQSNDSSNPSKSSLVIDSLEDVDMSKLIDSSPMKMKQITTTYDFTFGKSKSEKGFPKQSGGDESKAKSKFLQADATVISSPNESTAIEDLLDVADDFGGKRQSTDSFQLSAQKFIQSNSQQRFVKLNQHSDSRHSAKAIPPQSEISTGENFNYEIAKKLRILMFGTAKFAFSSEWRDQNFAFCDCTDRPTELRFGIVQKKGGPCGVLAAVQATVLKYLLFSSEAIQSNEASLKVSDAHRSACLIEAITEMLWRAGDSKQATLAILSPRKQFTGIPLEYRNDGITEHVVTINAFSKAELQNAVKQNINSLESGKGSCILLLYSAILSRSIDLVKRDMDDPGGKFMGAHNYCTQEMINLLLIGRATSNAFDNTIQLDGNTTLKGVHVRGEVGMLSLFEHYGSCKIGDHYKIPKYPIWLICCESHFTVLFGLDMTLISQTRISVSFDLYYYDGLANQDELIRLTVDTSVGVNDSDEIGDLVPPLEHCIRTKWPRAFISWNDSDPLL